MCNNHYFSMRVFRIISSFSTKKEDQSWKREEEILKRKTIYASAKRRRADFSSPPHEMCERIDQLGYTFSESNWSSVWDPHDPRSSRAHLSNQSGQTLIGVCVFARRNSRSTVQHCPRSHNCRGFPTRVRGPGRRAIFISDCKMYRPGWVVLKRMLSYFNNDLGKMIMIIG